VIAEVVRLLDAGLGEALVLRWLEESGKNPGRPSADELVALKKAGASDELVSALLDRSRAALPASAAPPTTAPAAAPAPATPANPATPAVPAAASASPASSPSSPAPVPPAAPPPGSRAETSAGAGARVPVDAALRYVHVADEGEPWDLVVYLDGTPFDPVPAAPTSSAAGTWSSQRQLAPGRHVLGWAQEMHREDPSRHAARFDPEPLEFDLAAGGAATIEFEFRDRTGMFLRMGGPVTVRIAQDGRELATRNSSGDPASWPLLCEEIEANLRGGKPRLVDRQMLRDCVRWNELWEGVPDLPTRDAVRPKSK
jgi:hypothetical protein